MSKLDKFLADAAVPVPDGIEWSASVTCSVCGEGVDDQMYYPNDSVLVWKCSAGHRTIMENFSVF